MKQRLILKLIFSIVGVSILVTVISTSTQLYLDYREEMKTIDGLWDQIETANVPTIVNQLWVGDFEVLAIQLEGMTNLPYIQFIELRTDDADNIQVGTPVTGEAIIWDVPMIYTFNQQEIELGLLHIELAKDLVYERLWQKLNLIVINYAAIVLVVSVFIFFVFQRLIMRHLITIAGYSRHLGIKNLNVPLQLNRPDQQNRIDELQEVANGMNEMRLNLLAETEKITALNQALQKFVPQGFLQQLGKKSIVDIRLGDNVEGSMSVLFTDIRSFTTLSENMVPRENFDFLNSFLSHMEPAIQKNQGFIDKYIGDAIMAIFPKSADTALHAAVEMKNELHLYNAERIAKGQPPIRIGIGINTGKLMLGTIGGTGRMDGTVISDAVNLASRVEGMTKLYGATLLISEAVYAQLESPDDFEFRVIDRVKAKGKLEPVTIYEVYSGDDPETYRLKQETLHDFEQGVSLYQDKHFEAALGFFHQVLTVFSTDKAAQIYEERCQRYLLEGPDDNWDGVERLDHK